MLLEKINSEEIDFMENWNNPICMAECLFSNFDDLGQFDKEKLGHIRNYQLSFPSYEPLIDTNVEGLSEKERFKLRKKVGDVINVGARKYGKTLIVLRLDIVLSLLYDDNFPTALYSIDEKRIRGVLDHIKKAGEYHPIIKLWDLKCGFKPHIKFESKKNHWMLQGVNLTIKGKSPGDQWYQIHAKKIWGEEVSFETEVVYNKRTEAESELGAIIRLAGMTNFVKHSPIGEEFGKLKNRHKLVNLPQFVNPFWDEEEKQKRIEKYGGEDTVNFKVFVKGEIVEDGISEMDMDRVRKCYHKRKTIKRFEIGKDKFDRFRDLIVVERPKNAERIFLCADIGDKQTEIIILSEVESIYNYLYNITLYNLIKDEQEEVFKWLIGKVKANVIGIECTEAMGRILADEFERVYSKNNVVRYMGTKKIDVDIIKGKKGLEHRQEYMSEWSVRRLKVLLYEQKCKLPIDYRFDKQFTKLISTKSGQRRTYKCLCEDDHLFDTFKVFAITQWFTEFNITPEIEDWGTGCSSWT